MAMMVVVIMLLLVSLVFVYDFCWVLHEDDGGDDGVDDDEDVSIS